MAGGVPFPTSHVLYIPCSVTLIPHNFFCLPRAPFPVDAVLRLNGLRVDGPHSRPTARARPSLNLATAPTVRSALTFYSLLTPLQERERTKPDKDGEATYRKAGLGLHAPPQAGPRRLLLLLLLSEAKYFVSYHIDVRTMKRNFLLFAALCRIWPCSKGRLN